jgi:predicted aspartyl protease
MRTRGAVGVGRFSVELEIANNDELAAARLGLLPADQVRRERIQGVVDSGATKLVLPEDLVERLGLPPGDSVKVRYVDGRQTKRSGAQGVYLELLGRNGTFSAIVEPSGKTALVGAIVLEDLDLLVDCSAQRLIPRDPTGATFEIE